MKATILVTQECNLDCDYCYITKRNATMDGRTAVRILDFIADRVPAGETVDIGFFGGEPLLEPELILEIARMARHHRVAEGRELTFQVVTNGTLLSSDMVDALVGAGISIGVSYDGTPGANDAHRLDKGGRPSSGIVERNIEEAASRYPLLMVNAVYRPDTVADLGAGVRRLFDMGVRYVYLNPDYSARWSATDMPALKAAYDAVGAFHAACRTAGDPVYVNLIDSKIAVLAKGGYAPGDTCSMGRRELAFTPAGRIYPCERLVGDGLSCEHCIGDIDRGIDTSRLCGRLASVAGSAAPANSPKPSPCDACSIRRYCMHWCGCSNFFATGDYDSPGAFICASEKAAIELALTLMPDMDGLSYTRAAAVV